jgi:acyl carrier protein
MTEQKLIEVLKSVDENLGLHEGSLDMQTSFKEQGYDSLDYVEFVINLEKYLNINLADSDVADLKYPHELVTLILEEKKYKNLLP